MYIRSSASFFSHPFLVLHFSKVRKELRKTEYAGDFRETQAKLLAYSMKIPRKKAADLIERHLYQSWEYSFKGIKPFKDVRPALLSLKRDGIHLGALSDFPVQRKLEFLGVSDLMEIAFSSEETGHLKPHTAPFYNMISRFGISPDEILYVGNNYKYDILGAKNAGLRTAHLVRKPEPDSLADFSFYSFLDLRDWILTLNN